MRTGAAAAIGALILALSAPTQAGHKPGAAPYREVLLHLPGISITWSPDRVMCLDPEYFPLSEPGVDGATGTVWGYPSLLAPHEDISNGWVLRGAGHTVVLQVGSKVALVDGRPFELEGVVTREPTAEAPLNRVGAVLGYTFLTGSYVGDNNFSHWWFIRLPKGRRVPDAIEWVRRVDITASEWVLVIWKEREGGGPRENCGDLYRGSIIRWGETLWGEAAGLVKAAGWAFRWDRRRERGEIRFERGLARVRLTRDRAGLPHSVVVEQVAYRLPPRVMRIVASGRLLLPLDPVAKALGWQYRTWPDRGGFVWISAP